MMAQLSITEALAELKTIGKRIEKKREFVMLYLYRQDRLKDPLEKTGGSVTAIQEARQSIADLEGRQIQLRRRINDANAATMVTVGSMTRSIADWIIWKRDVAPAQATFLGQLSGRIAGMRKEATQKGFAVTGGTPTTPDDILVCLDELALAAEREALEDVAGRLDGQLSLKNATTLIEA